MNPWGGRRNASAPWESSSLILYINVRLIVAAGAIDVGICAIVKTAIGPARKQSSTFAIMPQIVYDLKALASERHRIPAVSSVGDIGSDDYGIP
jgi:hypothetical protein